MLTLLTLLVSTRSRD